MNTAKYSQSLNYRPEIDGIRAIAVVSVILCHAKIVFLGREWFAGGFIGVDVFFVISGYLITRIILSELQQNQSFSFATFYERRARRLLPMLFTVIVAFLPFAWVAFTPERLVSLAESLLAAIFFSSNIYFYTELIDYYSDSSLTRPFLHTWSLGVEEQFYLLFPPIMVLGFQHVKERLMLIVFLVLGVSLVAAQYIEDRNQLAGFYLPFFRFWELAVGCVLAFIQLNYNQGDRPPRHLVNLLSFVGIGLIAASVVIFDERTPHPGFYTLLPVTGTGLLIAFSSGRDLVGRALGSRPFVAVGVVSYSAYLWHYPIFALSDLLLGAKAERVLPLIAVTFLLSFVSYRWIERPFRSQDCISRGRLIAVLVFSLISISGVLFAVLLSNGANFYKAPEQLVKPPEVREGANIALLGDSHAEHLLYGLQVLTKGGVVNFTSPGCIPFRNIDRYDFRFEIGACSAHTNSALDTIINDPKMTLVIMSSMGPVYLDNTSFQGQGADRVVRQNVIDMDDPDQKDRYLVFESGFTRTVEELLEAGKQVVFFSDIPELGIQYGACLTKSGNYRWRPFGPRVEGEVVDTDGCKYERTIFEARTAKFRALLRQLSKKHPQVVFVDPTDAFCDPQFCFGFNEATLIYRDYDHLNEHGSKLAANLIRESLQARGGDF
ncbi:MAG: acyltransferase family protein [Pseudomonadota bacterium]